MARAREKLESAAYRRLAQAFRPSIEPGDANWLEVRHGVRLLLDGVAADDEQARLSSLLELLDRRAECAILALDHLLEARGIRIGLSHDAVHQRDG